MSVVTETPTAEQGSAKHGKNALFGAMFGFFADMYDIYLPVVALAPAMVYFQPEDSSTIDTAVFAALIFTASILGRPLGSLIFGPLGDRIGRRTTTLIAAGGSAVCTGIMCVMPGYAAIGIWALVMLVVLRLLDGVFLGGEYTAANPLAMEHAPKHRRGVYGSLINMGFPLSLAFITVVTMITLHFLPAGDAFSAYAVWGWRIPFVIGFILCLALFIAYLRAVPESELWATEDKPKGPIIGQLFAPGLRRVFLLACVTVTGLWFSMNGTVGVFAGHFQGLGVDTGTTNAIILVASTISAALFPVVGHLSQRLGRRRVILAIGTVILILGTGGMVLAVATVGTALMAVSAVLMLISGFLIWATITAFLIELFPTHIRATGYGIAYAIPSIVPAFYAYYMVWIDGVLPYEYTPAVIIALGGLLIVGGSASIRDARDKDLADI